MRVPSSAHQIVCEIGDYPVPKNMDIRSAKPIFKIMEHLIVKLLKARWQIKFQQRVQRRKIITK